VYPVDPPPSASPRDPPRDLFFFCSSASPPSVTVRFVMGARPVLAVLAHLWDCQEKPARGTISPASAIAAIRQTRKKIFCIRPAVSLGSGWRGK
jgi:hypothetical protein